MIWYGNLIVATFNLTWWGKIKYVVIGLLYGCNAMRKLEISLKKILRMKKPVKIFVFLLFGKYKYFATVDLFSEFHPWWDSTLFFIMKWLLMIWMCQKCHLKEIQCERQTPLDQDLISICSKICPWKHNSPFWKLAIFQSSNFANRQWS